MDKERLQKILSAHGIASRRKAEQLILDGRVTVNDITATLGQSATFNKDTIAVDGVPLSLKDKHVYIVLNKPCGYLTTVTDDFGRKTVMELVSDLREKVYPVGRLDLNSEGLLIFTNDGDFANRVMHPSYEYHKTYVVKVRGDAKKAVELLCKPITIDSHVVSATNAELLSTSADGGVISITIAEGRNRQIRKMCAECGVSVKGLKRVSIDSLELGDLESGKWRHLTNDELAPFV